MKTLTSGGQHHQYPYQMAQMSFMMVFKGRGFAFQIYDARFRMVGRCPQNLQGLGQLNLLDLSFGNISDQLRIKFG